MTRAHAKVNLDLRVLGTRADGFHELRTVFQTIELHDTLTCDRAAGPVHREVPHARRAARRHQSGVARGGCACGRRSGAPGEPRDAVVTIDKTIPMQAGLGGGSADAAAALLGARRGCGAARRSRCCARSAPAIGADVAVLPVRRHRARPRPRRGDLSARRSAAALDRRSSGRRSASRRPRRTPGTTRTGRPGLKETRELQILPVPWPTRAAQMINDLEPPVVRRHPEITALKAALARGRRRRGGDVGQRIGGFRPVSQPSCGGARASSRCRRAAHGAC